MLDAGIEALRAISHRAKFPPAPWRRESSQDCVVESNRHRGHETKASAVLPLRYPEGEIKRPA